MENYIYIYTSIHICLSKRTRRHVPSTRPDGCLSIARAPIINNIIIIFADGRWLSTLMAFTPSPSTARTLARRNPSHALVSKINKYQHRCNQIFIRHSPVHINMMVNFLYLVRARCVVAIYSSNAPMLLSPFWTRIVVLCRSQLDKRRAHRLCVWTAYY